MKSDELNNLLKKDVINITDGEYLNLKEEDFSSLNIEESIKAVQKISALVEKKEGKEERIKYHNVIFELLTHDYPSKFDLKLWVLEKMCKMQIESKMNDEAHKAMEQFVYNSLAKIKFKSKPKGNSFSFRTFSEYSIKDIEDETLSLSHPRVFNDPLDTILEYWLNKTIQNGEDDELEFKFRLLLKKITSSIKMRCFFGGEFDKDIENISVLMWSHYADSHKGFCVEYEFDRSFFEKDFNDSKKILMYYPVDYKETIKVDGRPNFDTALFQKSTCWQYECEKRLVQFSIDPSESKNDYTTIDCKNKIKAIYLGVKCSDADRLRMIKAIGSKDIPLYQMEIDCNDVTHFIKKQIG